VTSLGRQGRDTGRGCGVNHRRPWLFFVFVSLDMVLHSRRRGTGSNTSLQPLKTQYSNCMVRRLYHTGESRCVSFSLGVRADHMAFARVDSVRGCARGTGAWAQLATTSTGCFHRLGRVLRPRQASMCYRLQPKQSDRASVDDSRRRCTSAVMFFPRAGVAGDPTPVERGRA